MNDNVKHTPGPWTARPDSNREEADWTIVLNGSAGYDLMPWTDGQGVNPADARLIAAAPDLLAAAQALLGEADSTGGHTRTVSRLSVDHLRAAIEKATGGES